MMFPFGRLVGGFCAAVFGLARVAVAVGSHSAFPIILALQEARAAENLVFTEEQTKLLGIEVAPLARQAKTRATIFPARVLIPPRQIAVVSAPFAARIETLEVVEDQPVVRGTVLAHLNSPTLIRAQSEFLQAVNQEQFLRESLSREQSLSTDRIVSLKQMQATRNEHAQATASAAERRQILRDYGMAEEVIEQLIATGKFDSRTVAVAPLDGVVVEILIVPGQHVETQASLFKVARLKPLWLELQVPARQAMRFTPGLPVAVQGYAASGHIIAVGTTADRTTQSIDIRAVIDGDGAGLKPGLFVEVLVELPGPGEGTWQIPPEAVVRRGKDAFVFVKTENGFRAQSVVVEEETAEASVIRGPFRGDESIAVRGLVALKGAWSLGGAE
jgi:cobalt-zinc-cadmium efflux system membrane fusion protein